MQMDVDAKNTNWKLAQETIYANGLTAALALTLIEWVYAYPVITMLRSLQSNFGTCALDIGLNHDVI